MTDCTFDTPRRDPKPFVDNQVWPMIMRPVLRLWHRLAERGSRDHVHHLSDHLARDIGLDPYDMAHHRRVWPSESTNRPPV